MQFKCCLVVKEIGFYSVLCLYVFLQNDIVVFHNKNIYSCSCLALWSSLEISPSDRSLLERQ